MLSKRSILLAIVAVTAIWFNVSPAVAQIPPALGQSGIFAVLGGSTVTNTGLSPIIGHLGVSPGTAVTGFPPGTVTGGTIHSNDAIAQQAESDLATAYNDLAGRTCNTVLTGVDLGGRTVTPGVSCFATSAQLTGTLTLDATGNPNAVFIFQIGSTLTTASQSRVVVINGASNCNVFWQVGSAATLGTGTQFAGNILALASITLTTGAAVSGRVLARNGAVTLDTSNVGGCSIPPPVCPSITLSPSTLPSGSVGVAYSQTITGNGGSAPYAFSVTAGALPAGLTLAATGVLAGTPLSPGSSTFTVRGTDANGCFTEVSYTILISIPPPPPPQCPTIAVSPAVLPNGTTGVAYSQTITGSGGTAPYTFGVTAGTLPPGVVLTAAGLLAGTPTTPGSSSFTIRATDANGCFGELAYTILVAAPPPPPPVCPAIVLSPTTLPNGAIGVAYSRTITGGGGMAPYIFGVTAGALPGGITLTAAGLLAGTPTTPGTSAFTIRGTDANGCFAEISYTILVPAPPPPPPVCPTIGISPGAIPNGTVGTIYSQTFVGSGGTGPYTFGVTAGALPPGLTLTAAGTLAGTPTTGGTYSFTLRATDATGCFRELPYLVTLVFAVASPIPAVSGWTMMALMALLAYLGFAAIRDRPGT